MRIVIADCEIDYEGRLVAHLPRATRMILVKSDGTVVVHADKGHKALNWMSPPCTIAEGQSRWTVVGSKGETLDITLFEILSDARIELGEEPGLIKSGSEADLQEVLADNPEAIVPGASLIRREHVTDLGPVDLLLRDPVEGTIAVEVKRVAELAAVEQLSRYLERMEKDSTIAPVRGVLVAQVIKPQTKVLAESRGIGCVEVDFSLLSGKSQPAPTLFDEVG